jgi:hypothetical protein
MHGEDFPLTLMRGSPACAVEPVHKCQETLDLTVWRLNHIASSFGRPVYTGLKRMKGLAPHPWSIIQ